ncbi:prepilin peptidase [Planctomicrobium sp. SH661]|uniref:prepilin peptidase n=1 Tax=Planctomicrobium sp. SH661 TaxID=3448124 RepID=UPI003F5BCA11
MSSLSLPTIILILAVSAFTAAAAFMDFRTKRIPNKLTLPMFFAGWVYQLGMSIAYGWEHLGSAALGFLVGFGLLFVLWFIGGGGGGDVKLMGALSVWLGFQMTLAVLFVSTLFVLAATSFVVVRTIIKQGLGRTREKYLATGKTKAGQPVVVETRDDKMRRRVMAYAGPVAVATWMVLFWNVPRIERELHAESTAHTPAVESVQ